jgi:hypothetical protein
VTRPEACVALGVSITVLLAGLVWLCGPWGLIVPGAAGALIALFGLDVSAGGARGQSLANPSRPARR